MILKKISTSLLLSLVCVSVPLSAVEYELSLGTHDFVVQNIVNDVAADGIESGTSHTFGVNAGLYVKHETESGISLLGKAEFFLDYDTDHLDPDHLPIFIEFLIDIRGPLYRINDTNLLKWYALMDNKQNTVSCVEREVRQYIGLGNEATLGNLTIDTNLYTGFYYIELDDDTPGARGYDRQAIDDGEASVAFELGAQYDFSRNWYLYTKVKRYVATGGFNTLEDNFEAHLSYTGSTLFENAISLNLKVKYTKYDFDRFFLPSIGVPVLPFDNDMLIQAYATFPFEI